MVVNVNDKEKEEEGDYLDMNVQVLAVCVSQLSKLREHVSTCPFLLLLIPK